MNKPLLSIVIANYNYGRFLEEAIQSVLSQSCDDYELIIVDGGSTDNSVEIIKKYEDKIAWWVSEKDKGQSDAFNKGFAYAKGRFLTWLNADDVMLPGAMEKLKCTVARHPNCEWFVGGVMWLDEDMKIIKCGRGRPFSKIRAKMGSLSVWGPSSIFSRRLFDMAGPIEEGFHYTMDTELWMRFYYNCGAIYEPFADYAWGLRIHKDAKTSSHFFSDKNDEVEEKKHNAIVAEVKEIFDRYKPPLKKTLLRFILSFNVYGSCMGRIDSVRYKGMHYNFYFERKTLK